jgi:ubiquinone/menaquinone biosynthesis C-methylase UbiE
MNDKQTYLLNSESAAEMARLLRQDRFFRERMGGPFPEKTAADMKQVYHLLDIGCGPGGWCQQVAQMYPHIEVTGIDISTIMITFARQQAELENLSNAKYEVMNALEQLDFPDHSFDLVTMQLACAWIPTTMWFDVILEIKRVLRPGGTVRLVEIDHTGIGRSAALDKLHAFTSRLYYERGKGFSATGQHFAITPMLLKMVREAGFMNDTKHPFAIETSIQHKEQRYNAILNTKAAIQGLASSWLQFGIIKDEVEVTRLLSDIEQDMLADQYCSLVYGLVVCGEKPTSY